LKRIGSDSLISSFFGLLLGGCLLLTIVGGFLVCIMLFLIQDGAGDAGIMTFVGIVVILMISIIPVVYYSIKNKH